MTLKELMNVSHLWNELGTSLTIKSKDGYMMYDSANAPFWKDDDNAPEELLRYEVLSIDSEEACRYSITIDVSSENIMYSPEMGFRTIDDLLEEYCEDLKDGYISRDMPFSEWVLDVAVHIMRLSE